jgi:hypothetical protein
MFQFANSLTETLSSKGNSVIILMVIVIVMLVLSLAYFAMRRLNAAVDRNGSDGVRSGGDDDQGG